MLAKFQAYDNLLSLLGNLMRFLELDVKLVSVVGLVLLFVTIDMVDNDYL